MVGIKKDRHLRVHNIVFSVTKKLREPPFTITLNCHQVQNFPSVDTQSRGIRSDFLHPSSGYKRQFDGRCTTRLRSSFVETTTTQIIQAPKVYSLFCTVQSDVHVESDPLQTTGRDAPPVLSHLFRTYFFTCSTVIFPETTRRPGTSGQSFPSDAPLSHQVPSPSPW